MISKCPRLFGSTVVFAHDTLVEKRTTYLSRKLRNGQLLEFLPWTLLLLLMVTARSSQMKTFPQNLGQDSFQFHLKWSQSRGLNLGHLRALWPYLNRIYSIGSTAVTRELFHCWFATKVLSRIASVDPLVLWDIKSKFPNQWSLFCIRHPEKGGQISNFIIRIFAFGNHIDSRDKYITTVLHPLLVLYM